MLEHVYEWCCKLSKNYSKSNIVHFRPSTMQRSNYNFTCDSNDINYVDSYKYLGIWFNEHITWCKAVRDLSKSPSRAPGFITAKYYACGGMTYKVFTKLYESKVQPIL